MAKRGTFNLGLRMEGGFALLATMVSSATGGKARMADFMPHSRNEEDDPDRVATAEDIQRLFHVRTK